MSSDSDLAMAATLDYSGVSQGYDAIISGASRAQQGMMGQFSKSKGDFASIGKDIGNNLVGGISAQFGPLGSAIGGVATALGPVGIAAGIAGAAIVGMVATGIQAASQFETAMSGAKKVISLDAGADSGAYFAKLGDDLQKISLNSPVAATDLAALAAVGGSLGVGADQIAGFAETAAQMSVAFELPAEVAATSAAKILNAFQQPISTENMQSLGNVINQIGDSMAATESDILDFTNRASFLNTTMGLSVTQVATLGGVLISAGLTAETAAGGLKSAMNTLTSESSKTGGMDNWAKLMGVGVDELKEKVAGDLPNTLIETANKIAAIEDPVTRFQTAVAMAGSEGAPALLKLAGATDTYNSALSQTISQWDAGQNGESGGMAKTFEQNSGTFSASMTMLQNAMTYSSVAIGNVFLPVATSVAGGLKDIVVGGTQAGQALGSLVTGSAAFQAISSAASSVGNVIKTTFGNFVSIITPAWDALGGGTAAMDGLQTVFNALTTPVTVLFTEIGMIADVLGTVAEAMSPVAEAIGSGLGEAITYASAFVQALSEIVGQSAPIRALASAFDTIQSAISAVSDIAGKVFDGLTNAIPTAASGLITAVGSLFGQAGDAAVDTFGNAVMDSPLGPVLGFVSDVASRADEIVKTGKESAEAMAKGIDESEKLKQAQKDAVDLSNPENLEAAKKAGIDIGDAAGSEIGAQAAKKASEEFEKQFKQEQIERDITNIVARAGNEALTANKGNVAGSVTTELEAGLEVQVAYQGNNKGIASRLFINGQQMGDAVYGANREDSVRKLLEGSGLGYNEGNVLDLTGKSGEAEVWRLKQTAQIEFDYSGISVIFGDQFASRLENEGDRIAATASEEVQSAYQSLLNALKEPTWDNLDEILGQMDALIAEHELDPLEASLWSEKYKEVLVSGIVDISEFAKSQAEDLNSQIASAFSDFDFSESDRKLVLAMKPMLDAVKAESPKAFSEAGLAGIDKFVEMVKNDASSSDLYTYFKTLGTTAGRTFAEAMNSNFGEIDFDWNKMWGNDFLSSLSDLDAFAENMFQPELIELASDALERYNTGTDEYVLQAEQMIDNAEILAEKNKWLFTDEDYDALVQYKNNTMSLGTVLSILADEADDSSQGVKKFTKEVEDADTECGKLLSTFGAWQELNSSLWRPEYIGPSFGKEYDNALIANAAYSYVASAASQRYTDSLNGVINAKSEELRVSELLLEKAHAGTLTDEDLALAVRTYGVELTATNEKAETLAETLGNFNNEFQGDITSTISFDSDLPQHNEIVSTLTLDTVTALSEYESFRSNIEGTVITAKLSTQIETTVDRVSSQLQGIDFDEEQTVTRRISFKTATPGLGNQTGVGEQDASTGLLQSIYLGLNQNTNRLVAALNSNGASDRTLIRTNTSTISTAVANASSTITSAVNNGAAAIVSAIQDMSNGCGSGINVGSVGGASSSESYFSTTTAGSSSFSGYSSISYAGFSEGGYADKPTFALVGDSPGGEYMVPAGKLDQFLSMNAASNASIGLSLDSSSLQDQIQKAVQSISVPAIPVPVKLSFDPESIKSQLTSILYEIFAEMR